MEYNDFSKSDEDDPDCVCGIGVTKNDPTCFIRNNIHPVWYLVDDDGNHIKDSNRNKVLQFHIPEELNLLSIYEKLLICCYANFVHTVHLSRGIFSIKEHCVTFPQDITDILNPKTKTNQHLFLEYFQ